MLRIQHTFLVSAEGTPGIPVLQLTSAFSEMVLDLSPLSPLPLCTENTVTSCTGGEVIFSPFCLLLRSYKQFGLSHLSIQIMCAFHSPLALGTGMTLELLM